MEECCRLRHLMAHANPPKERSAHGKSSGLLKYLLVPFPHAVAGHGGCVWFTSNIRMASYPTLSDSSWVGRDLGLDLDRVGGLSLCVFVC